MADSNRCHGQGHVSENREYAICANQFRSDYKRSSAKINSRNEFLL